MSAIVEAEVSFGDAKVILRGPQEFVTSEVTRLAGLARGTAAPPSGLGSADGQLDGRDGAGTEREFVALKSPKGHHEVCTVLAFWLTIQGASEFSEARGFESYSIARSTRR